MNMNYLKVAWVTPFSSASSVSEFSHTVLESLENDGRHEYLSITVFVNRNGESFPSRWPVVDIRGFFPSISDAGKFIEENYDFVFFNMGNNVENHGDIFELIEHCRGIVILHDVVYQHYYANLIFEKYKSPLAYAYAMAHYYGARGLEAVKLSGICSPSSTFKFAPWDTEHAADFPFIDAVLDNSNIIGAIVNSQFCFEKAAKSGKPLLKLRLPGDEKLPIDLSSKANLSRYDRERLTVVSFGHIQKSKQLDFIIETIAGSEELRESISFTIAGKPSDKNYVQELISLCAFHGLNEIVTIELSVSSKRLNQLKEQADIFLNIRYPNTEGGSGSLIEQMACGKPIVAMRSGCFAEMDAGVIYIDNVEDEKELEKAILQFCRNRSLLKVVGEDALRVSNSYMAKSYVKDAVDFARTLKIEKNECYLKGSHLQHVLNYDGSVFSPRVVYCWTEEVMRGFLDVYFDGKASAESLDYFCNLRRKDIGKAIEIYNYICGLKVFFGAPISENQRWRVPDIIPSELFVFLSLASLDLLEKYSLALSYSTFHESLVNYIDSARSRISFRSPAERVCFLLSMLEYLPVEKEPSIDSFVPIPCSPSNINKLSLAINGIVLAPDAQYIALVKKLGPENFDEKSYLAKYTDLRRLNSLGSGGFEHFINHGYSEGRAGGLKFSAIVEALELVQISKSTTGFG